MEFYYVPAFRVMGLAVRLDGDDMEDYEERLQNLWHRIFAENVRMKIPKPNSELLFGVQTDFDGEEQQRKTILIGYDVSEYDYVPEGLSVVEVQGGHYFMFSEVVDYDTEPSLQEEIINAGLDRNYITDFEVYDRSNSNGRTIDIKAYIGIHYSTEEE
ncbi:GyrI-like domain-containing protein [Membranihabitans marinus]|uniref:GyrI-like domain-containing protein n=1 Tax=Membranihabitans marinus TaxID=1227546 RepID=UPI001F44CBB3|nr:effector binding domain-containing protein [Membranihabitans marinus]